MQNSHGPISGSSDARLTAALHLGAAERDPDPFPAAALMARHWQPVLDYASLFTPSRATAEIVAATAFSRSLETLRATGGSNGGGSSGSGTPDGGPSAGGTIGEGNTGLGNAGLGNTGFGNAGRGNAGGGNSDGAATALRPLFLVAARRVLRAWAASTPLTAALPGIQAPAEPGDDRLLTARAFRALSVPAQVLLWHREVEAEGLSIPAALLAVDPRGAAEALAEARERLRAGCVAAHHELAPDAECRHYGRLLDISLRRTGPLIPDIVRHLARCPHCRYAADQLRHFDARLPLLLAEAVLGEGAARYLDSRPARRRPRGGPGGGHRAGRHAAALRGRVAAGLRWRGAVPGRGSGGTALRTSGAGVAVAATVAAVAVAAVAAALWPDGAGPPTARPPAGTATPTADGAPTPLPPRTAPPPPAVTPPPPAQAGHPAPGALRTRLRGTGAGGACLDVRGGTPAAGAELVVAECSGAATQLWSYEPDGLLRNAAAPGLCADAGRPEGTVVLGACAPGSPDVRYDLTVQGTVVPRRDARLALAPAVPAAGASVVVRLRDGTPAQHWLTDAADSAAPPPATPGAVPPSGPAGSHPPAAPRSAAPPSAPATPPGTGPAPGAGAVAGPGAAPA
ncbi:ricin-type beta-trefoil lectin domain protein [Streptomyces kanasensis]|uniref:ricin-type beta-trefoil lectin domain protein n=1 Tax=Streptomyces kanasensis TaxID=936756 RepID=UPI0038168060